jgi:hypothetical protein
MKKLLILAGISVLLLLSCSVLKGIIFDNSIPKEQSTEIINWIGTITGYNGITVEWNKTNLTPVQIPAGDTLLEFDLNARKFNILYFGKGWLFRYNFQPQKVYVLDFSPRQENNKDILGVNIYTFNVGEKIPLSLDKMKANFTAFVPFLNNPKGDQKTILD